MCSVSVGVSAFVLAGGKRGEGVTAGLVVGCLE